MGRLAVVLLLMLAVLSAGCAAQKASFPPGEDTDKMLAEIEAHGRGNLPAEPVAVEVDSAEPPGGFVSAVSDGAATCAITGMKTTATCAVLAITFAYIIAAGKSGGGYPGAGDGVSKVLHDIWAD